MVRVVNALQADCQMTNRRTVAVSRRDSFQMDSPVLLRPATPSVSGPVQRFTGVLHKCQTVMKESPLNVLGLSTKRNPKISEVIQQTKVLCEVLCASNVLSLFFIIFYICPVIYYNIL